MSASRKRKPKYRPAFVPSTAQAMSVEFDDVSMSVHFRDGRILSVPLAWFPLLQEATPKQRAKYTIGGSGISLHWPDLDEDLSIAGLMAGVDQRAG